MPPEALSRDPVSQASLLTLTGRGPAYLDEIEAALEDNPALQEQFAVYIRETVRGEARGIAKGRKQDLTRLLERRFGPLSDADRARIEGADLDQLDAWIDRVLDAKSLKAVFGEG